MAKLTDKQRKKIIAESVNGSSIRALAAKYGVSTTTIQRVLKSDTTLTQKVTQKKAENTASILAFILNTKKTKIKKLSEGFKFLQIRFKLTETGKVLRKMSFESIKKIRRKLKKFKRWNIEGRVVKIAGKFVRRIFPLSDICSAYESWRGHMKRGNSFHAVERMDLYFKKLFGFHPNNKIEWRKALCT